MNNTKITLFNDNILVSELTDDLLVNRAFVKYDSDSSYMFCKIEEMSTQAKEILKDKNKDEVYLIIKRYAKEEYLPGYFFISSKDVRGYITVEDYNQMLEDAN